MRLKVWGNLFRREKISAKTQGMKKMKSCNFWGFPKSGEEILKIYFTSIFFFFLEKIYFKKFHPKFWKTPKIS